MDTINRMQPIQAQRNMTSGESRLSLVRHHIHCGSNSGARAYSTSDPTREQHVPHIDIDALKPLETAPEHADVPKHPHDPEHINPKLASDVRYWAQQFHVDGPTLHEVIRVHGTSVEKVRIALSAR